jgi:hypothetical protein
MGLFEDGGYISRPAHPCRTWTRAGSAGEDLTVRNFKRRRVGDREQREAEAWQKRERKTGEDKENRCEARYSPVVLLLASCISKFRL